MSAQQSSAIIVDIHRCNVHDFESSGTAAFNSLPVTTIKGAADDDDDDDDDDDAAAAAASCSRSAELCRQRYTAATGSCRA